MTYPCPKGHASSDADYCSECGARIGAAAVVAPSVPTPGVPPPVASDHTCPDCGTPRVPGTRFCEVCRYDFQNRASFGPAASMTPPVAPPAPTPSTSVAELPPAAAAPAAGGFHKVSVAIIADPSLIKEPDPENPFPVGTPERVFPLDLEENLVGRRGDKRDIHPEIVVVDPGISHRHLKLVRRADGGFAVLELGSTNGTELNGKPLEAGVLTPLEAGDELVLGMWTRLIIRNR